MLKLLFINTVLLFCFFHQGCFSALVAQDHLNVVDNTETRAGKSQRFCNKIMFQSDAVINRPGKKKKIEK